MYIKLLQLFNGSFTAYPFRLQRFYRRSYLLWLITLQSRMNVNISQQRFLHYHETERHTNWKDELRVNGLRKKLCDEMFCFCLMHMQCSLLCTFWVASSIKGEVKQTCLNLYAERQGNFNNTFKLISMTASISSRLPVTVEKACTGLSQFTVKVLNFKHTHR